MLHQFQSHQHTVANYDRDFIVWHKGRSEYCFWAVPIDQPQWIDAFYQAGQLLQDYLVPQYRRQPHITILPAGFNKTDGLSYAEMENIGRSLVPFELSLGDLVSFVSCPCIEVKDVSGSLLKLRECLKNVMCDPDCGVSEMPFFPHVTVGLYDGVYSTELLMRVLDRFSADTVPIKVSEFYLASYRSADICGPIKLIARYPLGHSRGV